MDDYKDIAISAVKSICLRFRAATCEFLGEIELGNLLHKFVIGKIRDQRKYYYAENRDIKLNDDRERSRSAPFVREHAVENADSIWLDEQSALLAVPEQAYLEQMLQVDSRRFTIQQFESGNVEIQQCKLPNCQRL